MPKYNPAKNAIAGVTVKPEPVWAAPNTALAVIISPTGNAFAHSFIENRL